MKSDNTADETRPEGGTVLGVRFEDALRFAAETHRTQVRKGGTIPYVSHLLAVASLVLEDGGGEDDTIAALLHDAVEDQGGQTMLDEIRHRFGPNVARMVDACSDTDEIPKPPWRDRKERYVRHLDSEETPGDVLRISLADKTHNFQSIRRDYDRIGEQLWSRFSTGADDQLWYYGALTEIYRRRKPGSRAEELAEAVAQLARDRQMKMQSEVGLREAPDNVS
jgi:(p)ppGpp synthase/HD superfamily hydrolase